jgi:hypothetical protein
MGCDCGGKCRVCACEKEGAKPQAGEDQGEGGVLPPFGGGGVRTDSLMKFHPGVFDFSHDHMFEALGYTTPKGGSLDICLNQREYCYLHDRYHDHDGGCPGCAADERAAKEALERAENDKRDHEALRASLLNPTPREKATRAAKRFPRFNPIIPPEPAAEPEIGECTHYACVTWLDACAEDESYDLEDLDETPGVVMVSAGILAKDTEDVVVLVRDFTPENKGVRHILRIPRANVKSMVRTPLPPGED